MEFCFDVHVGTQALTIMVPSSSISFKANNIFFIVVEKTD